MSSDQYFVGASGNHAEFTTTHWGFVLEAGQDDSPQAAEALEWLCRIYWYPLYAYVRRQGHSPEDTEDLVQDFFARLLDRHYLRLADPNRGRFRTFLLTSLKHFLINEWARANREKRGGGRRLISLDGEDTETRFLAEPADGRSPDKVFERRWAMVVLNRVLDQLETELTADGRGRVFEELKSFLTGEENESTYAVIGERLCSVLSTVWPSGTCRHSAFRHRNLSSRRRRRGFLETRAGRARQSARAIF